EDDIVSSMDGRSEKGAERDEPVSSNVGIFKDGLSEDGGISLIGEVEGGSDSVDVFADGLVSEEDYSVEMKLI
ncbi:hypothetical protein KI387_014685, partial [Taxus chinensis]